MPAPRLAAAATPVPPAAGARRVGWPRPAVLLPALFVLGGLADELVSRSRVGPDFGVYHRAAARYLAGEELYRLSDGHLCFKYSPAAAALLAPLGTLPGRAAQVLFNLLSAAALLLWIRHASRTPGAGEGAWTGLGAGLFLMPLYALLFFLGQVDALLLALVLASERLAARRPVLAGAPLAAALLFKPPLLLLAAPIALARGWRRLAATGAWAAALLAASAARYGAAGAAELAAWRRLLAATTPPIVCDRANQSVFAVACSWIARPERPRAFAAGVAALGVAAALGLAVPVARVLRRDAARGRALALAAALYLAAFLSPLGWRVNLLALLPLVYVLLGLAGRARTPVGRGALLAVALAWLVGVNLMSDGILGHPRVEALELRRYAALAGLAIALAAAWGSAAEVQRAAAHGGERTARSRAQGRGT